MKLQLFVIRCLMLCAVMLLWACATQRNVQSEEHTTATDNSTLEQTGKSDKLTLDFDFFTAMCESLRVQFSADSIKGPGGTVYNPRLETEAEKPVIESGSANIAHESDSTSTTLHLDTSQQTDTSTSKETVVEVISPVLWWCCIGSMILNVILLMYIAIKLYNK